MGSNRFDKNIKDKLEGIELNYDASAWEAFEQKLDATISEEASAQHEFDEQIKEKLATTNPMTYEDGHWQELSDKIDYENALTNKIYTFKLIELVILFLLAYSFLQIKPIKKPSGKQPLYAHSEIFNKIQEHTEGTIAEMQKEAANAKFAVINNKRKSNSQDLAEFSEDQKSVTLLDIANNQAYQISTAVPESSLTAEVDAYIQEELAENPLIGFASIDNFFPKNVRESEKISPLIDKSYERPAPLANILALRSDKGEDWLSLSVGRDINLVNTPIEYLFSNNSRLLGAMGTTAQVSYSKKSGRNEFEVGLAYSYKSYDPSLKEIFGVNGIGIYESSLNNISFHIAQVPTLFKRYLVDNRKWSAYAAIGAVHNLILYSEYDLGNQLLSGTWSPNSQRIENSQLLRRNYYTGLFQNVKQNKQYKRSNQQEFLVEGDFYDNVFITSFAGFGIQRNFGLHKSIYLQTGYQHQIFAEKLGPNNDQINSITFNLGGKFRI